MAWQTPKTNWGQSGQTVPAATDFNRIEGNTQHLKDEIDSHKAEDASTTAKGHVQLNNTVTSTSTTQAATANAIKTVNDALTSHKADYAQHGVTMGSENDIYVAKIGSLFEFTPLESANYGGTIEAIATDDEFVYVGGRTTRTVRKLRKRDLSQVAESASYGGDIEAIAIDDEFVYVGGLTTRTVRVIENRDLIKIIRRYQ